jgi:Fe-S-cluster-containing hydrogenase component 2
MPASCTFGPYRFVGESSATPAARSQQDTVLRPHPSSIPGMIVKKYFRLLSVQNAGENFTPLCYHCEQRPCSHPGAPSGRELFLVKQSLPRTLVAA